jgi:hypothetical protein
MSKITERVSRTELGAFCAFREVDSSPSHTYLQSLTDTNSKLSVPVIQIFILIIVLVILVFKV